MHEDVPDAGERRSSASNSRPAQISTANAMMSPSTDGGHATVDFQQTSLTDDDYDPVQPLRQSQRPPAPPEQNLVIVSNRLPINVTWDSVEQQWALPVSSGGLVSALMGVGNVRLHAYLPNLTARCSTTHTNALS